MKFIACRLTSFTLALLAFTLFCGSVFAQSGSQTYGTLLSYDFDTQAWPAATTEAVGTIDTLGSATLSLAVRSSSVVASGLLPISISETNLGKLTLAFSLSASSAKPVTVTIQSYDSSKVRTGGLQTLVYPAAPDFYQRYAVDLSTCKPSGTGTFQPSAPYVCFSFTPQSGAEVRVDNVNYALPAYCVSTSGSNSNTGRSEAQAFLTPQKALDVAQAGDIIVVMGGTYISPNGPSTNPPASYGLSSVASFQRAGTPAAWIVLKNYPGQTPTFMSNAWNIIALSKGYNGHPSDVALSYLEVRGIHVRGEGDEIRFNNKYPDSVGQVDSRSNSNGISVDGRYMTTLPHHIRIADNVVEYCPGGGIGVGEADWMTTEGNVCRNNCWTMIYAASGISYLSDFNFDATDNVYKRLVRNNVCSGNQTFVPWRATGKISDGNGIIMDVNYGTNEHPDWTYIGRTLVQSNLSFNNGGSGIHSFKANRVDIIGNTAYLNSASPALQYAQISAGYADDVRIINNILVAPVANTAAGEPAEPVNGNGYATNVVYSHNLYFGGNKAPIMGDGDAIGDPKFLNPSRDSTVADFHLQATSPALGAGTVQPFMPFLDLDGRVRGTTPDIGVYQLTQTTTALSSSLNPSVAGSNVTFTATVSGSSPAGTVTFTDGGTTLGTGSIVNGVATLSTSSLGVGMHTITAAYGGDAGNAPGVSASLAQTVQPVVVSSVSVSPTSVTGGSQNATGTVTLTGAATAATTVTLTSSSSAISFPVSSVTIAAGATFATFRVYSHKVTTAKTVTITASQGGVSKTAAVTVTPPGVAVTLATLSFNPASVKGGSQNTTGTVTLTGAVPSATTLTLTSSSSAISFPVSTVTIAAGKSSATFRVYSHKVTATKSVSVKVTGLGISKATAITVTH